MLQPLQPNTSSTALLLIPPNPAGRFAHSEDIVVGIKWFPPSSPRHLVLLNFEWQLQGCTSPEEWNHLPQSHSDSLANDKKNCLIRCKSDSTSLSLWVWKAGWNEYDAQTLPESQSSLKWSLNPTFQSSKNFAAPLHKWYQMIMTNQITACCSVDSLKAKDRPLECSTGRPWDLNLSISSKNLPLNITKHHWTWNVFSFWDPLMILVHPMCWSFWIGVALWRISWASGHASRSQIVMMQRNWKALAPMGAKWAKNVLMDKFNQTCCVCSVEWTRLYEHDSAWHMLFHLGPCWIQSSD